VWLQNNGVDTGAAFDGSDAAIQLHSFEQQGVGLLATRNIERLATVAFVPRALCFSSEAGGSAAHRWAHGVFAKSLTAADRRQATVALKVAVEVCLGAASQWQPYIDCLPSAAALNLPALWCSADLQLLRGTLTYTDARALRVQMSRELRIVRKALLRISSVPLRRQLKRKLRGQLWLWARCAVMSRAFHLDDGTYVLAPLLDFCNHSDAVQFGVERGDGVFVPRNVSSKIQYFGLSALGNLAVLMLYMRTVSSKHCKNSIQVKAQ
jgi:SET domain